MKCSAPSSPRLPEARAELLALIDGKVEEGLAGVSSENGSPWLSVAQAAERLGVSEGALRQAIKRGARTWMDFRQGAGDKSRYRGRCPHLTDGLPSGGRSRLPVRAPDAAVYLIRP